MFYSNSPQVQAAQGYAALSLWAEAEAELDTLPDSHRFAIDVMEVRLAIHLFRDQWPEAEHLALCLLELFPERPAYRNTLEFVRRMMRGEPIDASLSEGLATPAQPRQNLRRKRR